MLKVYDRSLYIILNDCKVPLACSVYITIVICEALIVSTFMSILVSQITHIKIQVIVYYNE